MKKLNTGIHSIYISNLNYKNEEDQILGMFKEYGFVKNIKIMREGKDNKSRGCAFVDMVVLEDAYKAIEALNGSTHYGREIQVKMAKTQNFKANERAGKVARSPKKEVKVKVKPVRKPRVKKGLNALLG